MHKNNIIKLLNLQVKSLNLKDFFIEFVNNSLIIHISKKISQHECPCCKSKTTKIHDHRLQKIKHHKINGFPTFIYLKKTRLECKNCGKSFYMDYSDIVNYRFRCSNLLFIAIINDIQSTSMTIKDIALKHNVSPGVVVRYIHIFAHLMNWNNITSLPEHIGIDEFKGNCNHSKYLLHIYNLDTKETITVLKSRKFSDLIDFFNSIDNRNNVKIVTMDLYNTFKHAVNSKLKKSIIVADRFHYTRVVANALDKFRLSLWHNSKNDEKKFFKNIKLALLKDATLIPKDKIIEHDAKLNKAFEFSGDLKYAYQLYQSFLRIKDGSSYEEKAKLFKDWLSDALGSTLEPFRSAAKTLLQWHKEILNSFKTSYTNSSTEGKNNKIKVIKRNAFGFRNLDNLKYIIKLRDCKI